MWNLQIKAEPIPEYDSTGLGRESLLTRDNFLEWKIVNSQTIPKYLSPPCLLHPALLKKGCEKEWPSEVLLGLVHVGEEEHVVADGEGAVVDDHRLDQLVIPCAGVTQSNIGQKKSTPRYVWFIFRPKV